MALDQGVLDAVTNANFKAMAEMGVQNALAHQNRVNVIAEKAMAKSLESMDTTSVPEGLGLAAAQRGDLAKVVADLGAAVAGVQQLLKGAQTTIPTTG